MEKLKYGCLFFFTACCMLLGYTYAATTSFLQAEPTDAYEELNSAYADIAEKLQSEQAFSISEAAFTKGMEEKTLRAEIDTWLEQEAIQDSEQRIADNMVKLYENQQHQALLQQTLTRLYGIEKGALLLGVIAGGVLLVSFGLRKKHPFRKETER